MLPATGCWSFVHILTFLMFLCRYDFRLYQLFHAHIETLNNAKVECFTCKVLSKVGLQVHAAGE
jgi:hypothetical protein